MKKILRYVGFLKPNIPDSIINQVHSHLQRRLKEAFDTLPPPSNSKGASFHGLLAAKIEASLLKLSLVRARLRSSLYDYTPSSDSSTSVGDAVKKMDKKLKHKLRNLQSEEDSMKKQLAEYEKMLKMVDTKGGGFSQVVEDLARVKRETEECRKDLRRVF